MKSKIIVALILLNCSFTSACDKKNTAKAKIEVEAQTGYYELTEILVNGGDESFVSQIADTVIEDLNKHIKDVDDNGFVEIISPENNYQVFGHDNSQSYIINSNGKQIANDARHAAEVAILHGIRNTQIVGGNIYLKRAAQRSVKNEYKDFKLDMLAGKDFERYLRHKDIIDAAIESAVNSGNKPNDFAKNWQLALDLNSKLGVEKSSFSDFYGGAKGFIQSVLRLLRQEASFEDITFELNGNDLDVIIIELQRQSGKGAKKVIFTEKGFLNPIGHTDGGTGYTHSKTKPYLHFKGPNFNGSRTTDDILIGNEIADNLTGGTGRDWLDGGDGADTLKGGAGHDVLLGGKGDDDIEGGDGNDILFAGGGSDKLYGGFGDDTFFIKTRKNQTPIHDQFFGDEGSDTISFRYSQKPVNLKLKGTAQTIELDNTKVDIDSIENIIGSAFRDTLIGDIKSNTIFGSHGDDTIDGKDGDDIIEGGSGADVVNGGNGMDTLSYKSSQGGVDVSMETGKTHAFGGDASGDRFRDDFENLTGSSHSDVLEGNNLDNRISGLSGDDYIIASNGADIYDGGSGFDTVDYGNHEGDAGLNLDVIQGVKGYKYGTETSNGTHKINDIEHIVGTGWGDIIKFGDGNNVLEGAKGNDKLYGGRGDDIYFVEVGGGHDQIYENGAEGRDTIMIGYENGLSWNDIFLSLGEGTFSVKVKGETIASTQNGPYKGRQFKDVGIEVINFADSGEIKIDNLEAEYARNEPTDTNDVIIGHDNVSNLLQGLDGNDILIGGSDKNNSSDKGNLFHGGRGNDQMFAGKGNDIYIFDVGSGADSITDTGGVDHLYFGPGVDENSLLFEIKGQDLYLGLKPTGNEKSINLKASEMADRIQFVNSKGRPTYGIELYTIDNKKLDVRKYFDP